MKIEEKTLNIKDVNGQPVSLEWLVDTYPDLVAIDESGFAVDVYEINSPTFAEEGYSAHRRVLFWENPAAAENDPGSNAIAELEIPEN